MDPAAMGGPTSQVDNVAMMIEQALSQGAQIGPAEIIQALVQAAHEDQQAIMNAPAQIDQAMAGHVSRLLGGVMPMSQQVSAGNQLMQAGFGAQSGGAPGGSIMGQQQPGQELPGKIASRGAIALHLLGR